jgi:hypothetical protein
MFRGHTANFQAAPFPNPWNVPAILLLETSTAAPQHDDDVHLEFQFSVQLPRSEAAGYNLTAIAVSDCGEWKSAYFIALYDMEHSARPTGPL